MHNITVLFAMLAVRLPSKQISKTLFLGETKEALLEKKKETKLRVLCEYQHK